MKNLSKILVFLLVFCISDFGQGNLVKALNTGTVIINEVAWAGSVDSVNDEWIELYNTTNQAIDLTGWTISDDQGTSIYNLSGSIPAHNYFLIEDNENAVNPNNADIIINISLANTGDSLALYDNNNQLMDTVNSSGGTWYTSDSVNKPSMERVNALNSGDIASNWKQSTALNQSITASGGTVIKGTPGSINSVTTAPVLNEQLMLELSSNQLQIGNTLTVTAKITNIADLFSYGLEINYDPNILSMKNITPGNFLNSNSAVNTSFQAALENGIPGKLIVAEARTQTIKNGVSGNGNLFSMEFDVIGQSSNPSMLIFGSPSFMASPNNDLAVQFINAEFTSGTNQSGTVTNLELNPGAQRYSIQLSWNTPANGADKYKVYRKDAHQNWTLLGETNQNNFTDADNIANGGKIIPTLDYEYRIITEKNLIQSQPVEKAGQDSRGLKGDNNRSDRIDGRDLENLAQHFGEIDSDNNFDALIDTTFDGQIDGSDLIDLGTNFAEAYQN